MFNVISWCNSNDSEDTWTTKWLVCRFRIKVVVKYTKTKKKQLKVYVNVDTISFWTTFARFRVYFKSTKSLRRHTVK